MATPPSSAQPTAPIAAQQTPATSPAAGLLAMTNDDMIAIWSKAIDTQMHFNEMATKSRQLGLAFVAAALGVGLVLLGQGDDFSLRLGGGWRIHVTVFIIGAGVLALAAVRKLDLGVYHQMLRGAVAFGEDFEETHMKRMFQLDKGMTQAISHFSRHSDAEAKGPASSKYTGSNYKTAGQNVNAFYGLSMFVLALTAVIILLVTNMSSTTIENTDGVISVQPPVEQQSGEKVQKTQPQGDQ